MNILFVALYAPVPPIDGGRLRTYHILKQTALYHRVTLVCFADRLSDPAAPAQLQSICEQVIIVPRPAYVNRGLMQQISDFARRAPAGLRHWTSNEFGACLRELSASGKYQLAVLDHLLMAQYLPMLGNAPVILTHHNVERLLQQRQNKLAFNGRIWHQLAQSRETRKWSNFEIGVSRQADTLIAVSALEADYFRRNAPNVPTYVIPNGVDIAYFHPIPHLVTSIAREPRLLFTGRMDYGPNIDAMRWFCKEIFPLLHTSHPTITLEIVGRDPVAAVRELGALPGVHVSGSVQDVRPYYANARVCVVPLRAGAGTRLKILEAMAMGVPVVSTSLGSEGLDVEHDIDILCADQPNDFARAVLRLLDDPQLADRLSRQARQTVTEKYSWPVIGTALEKVYSVFSRSDWPDP